MVLATVLRGKYCKDKHHLSAVSYLTNLYIYLSQTKEGNLITFSFNIRNELLCIIITQKYFWRSLYNTPSYINQYK